MTNQQKNEPSLAAGLAMAAFIFFGIPFIIAFLLPMPRLLIAKLRNPNAPMPTHPLFEEPRPLTAQDREDLYWEMERESRKPRFER
jgi:hypothetical protein